MIKQKCYFFLEKVPWLIRLWMRNRRVSPLPVRTALLLLGVIGAGLGNVLFAQAPEFTNPVLIWADEFDGSEVDLSNWTLLTGDGTEFGLPAGWGNNELQYYLPENATVNGGLLTITAKEEQIEGYNYTSSRMITADKQDFTYGRFEMRAKMPIGQGIWPAFWMFFTGPGEYGGWAASGEIDIMEYLGNKPEEVFGTIHYGQPFPGNVFTGNEYILPSGNFNDDFHIFSVEWEPGEIRWYVDNDLYATQTIWWSNGGPYPAPFDKPFHLLLNLAVGGNLPGNPDASTVFPQEYIIDYVRVYQNADLPTVSLEIDDEAPAPGGSLTMTATPSATLGVSKVEFFQGDYKLGESTGAPYELTVSNLTEGGYKVRAVVTDNAGKVNYSEIFDVTVGAGGQGPYAMTPAAIPGRVEIELYDVGGQGEAFNDTDPALNRGSREAGNIFRANEGVDLEPTADVGGGSNVGFTEVGEWLEYTVEVAETGVYDLDLRLASQSSAGTLRILFDGVDKTGEINFIPTGGFQTWSDVRVSGLALDAGVQVMRIAFEGAAINLNKLTFTEAIPPTEVVFDDMEHGDPNNNGWFAFGGAVGGGGISPNATDLPPENGGSFSLETGWGSGGTPGFFGGFGRTNPTDLPTETFFNFWINPLADQDYILEINLQEDDNGDGEINASDDDEFQYNLRVGPSGSGAEVIAGGGWQLVSIPFSEFVDDNSFLTGGNGVLDPVAPGSGGNGELINVVWAVVSNSGADVNFRTDYWAFTSIPLGPAIAVTPESNDFGQVSTASCASQNFVLSNGGFSDLTISGIEVGGPDAADFSLTSGAAPLTLATGESQLIEITFTPSNTGAKSATLRISSNDPNMAQLDIPLSGEGIEISEVLFDDMEHGDPFANDYFSFGGDVGGGGIGPNTDVPPQNGGSFSIETGWGSGGAPGFYGGFGREFPLDLSGLENFSFWINPYIADQAFTLEVALQEDDNGDGAITQADDDEFQYNLTVGPEGSGAEVIAGGGWQLVTIPFSEFFDDPGFLFGGNDVLDPFATACGGNGGLINIVMVIIGTGTDANFRTDYWAFTTQGDGPDIAVAPPSLEFDQVAVNGCDEQTLTVSNEGSSPLEVSAVGLGGDNADVFSILSGEAPFTVAPGASQDIVVLFSPTAAQSYTAQLDIVSNDPDESSLSVAITGEGKEGGVTVFDDMEHGDPFGNGYFTFGGDVGGGGIDPNGADLPPQNGGSFSLQTGWGSGGTPGFYGGFGRTNPISVFNDTCLCFWIHPYIADQAFTIEVNLQEDDNGDGVILPADDDEFQYNLTVGPEGSGAEVIAGGGWQLVRIPLSQLAYDPSFLFGGNGVFDPQSATCGGNGELINIVMAIVGTGTDANFRTDFWAFTSEAFGPKIAVTPTPLDFGEVAEEDCEEQTLTVSNEGNLPLAISTIEVGGTQAEAFSIVSGDIPASLAPGETLDVGIVFSPVSRGENTAALRIISNDPEEGSLHIPLVGQGVEEGPVVFDDMEHGDPSGVGYFSFGGDVGGGGFGPSGDVPPENGGSFSIETGWGSGGVPGFYGGFGWTNPISAWNDTMMVIWIHPYIAGQVYTIEINLQEDDNGDGAINPADDDEFQYNLTVGAAGSGAEVIAGGGWQKVTIPFSQLFYDPSFLSGGNGIFDPRPANCGGNGELINIVMAIIGTGTDANFRTDYWAFMKEEECVTENLALGKPAQTSCDYGNSSAGLGVDGITEGSTPWTANPDIVHTCRDNDSEWWQVDLGAGASDETYEISEICVYNRMSDQPFVVNRLKDFYLFISCTPFDPEVSGRELREDPEIYSQFVSGAASFPSCIEIPNVVGQYVRLELPGNQPLHFAEIEVYGCPATGETCGPEPDPCAFLAEPMIEPAGPFLPTDGIQQLKVDVAGGVWGGMVSANGEFDPSIGIGSYEITYTLVDGICEKGDTITVFVNDPNAICEVPTNRAEGKPAEQSSTYGNGVASLAVDGDIDGSRGPWANASIQHTRNDAQAWWKVDLEEVVDIKYIEIYNRTDCCGSRLRNFVIFSSEDPIDANRSIEALRNDAAISSQFFSGSAPALATIPLEMVGRYIAIKLTSSNAPLHMAEVRVFGCPLGSSEPPIDCNGGEPENLALNGLASQSSTYGNGLANLAIDGNREGASPWSADLQHTQTESTPWWALDLGTIASIEGVRIFNRSNNFQGRLRNFYVFVSPNPIDGTRPLEDLTTDESITYQFFPGAAGSRATFNFGGIEGGYVLIKLSGSPGILHMAEVEVFGCDLGNSGSRFADANTQVNPTSQIRLQAFPNPFTGTFTLKINGALEKERKLRLVNTLGQTLEVHKVWGNEQITLGKEIAKGMYFIQLVDGDTIHQIKVMKVN